MFTQKFLLHLAASIFISLCFVAGVTAHAASATVAAGQAVTLSATADGTAPFTYQWYKDGAILSGATASTYPITAFQTNNAGVYSAVISNSAGSTTSDTGTLTLANSATAPVFTAQPASQTVTAGAGVTFTAAASGSPAPTYQWQKNGSGISGATGASYTIAITAIGDAGSYAVVATNSVTSVTSGTATLTVNAATSAPVFTTQPVNQMVTAGNWVLFTAAAIGLPTPTFQWQKGGVNISGATGASLTIMNIVAGDAGSYTVVATNSVSSVISSTAILTVNAATSAPAFTTQPVSQTVVAAAGVTFTAAASGNPLPTYQWRKNGTNITGATGAFYAIASAAIGDAATYTLVATNSVGSVTSNGAVLTVNSVPAFITQPSSQTVTAGAGVTFTAAASGTPSPTYQWQKNGSAIAGATNAAYTIASTAAGDAGTYTMVATNAAGPATSAGAVLTVNPVNTAPTISVIPAQTTGLGTAIGPISFIVGDSQTAAGSLTVSGLSSNTMLVPAGNIFFGGNGANRTVTLTPAAGQTGTTTITVTVSDGLLTSTASFILTVSALSSTTQTVSNSAAMAIPDSGPASVYPSNITISGLGGTIGAVTVRLNNFSHTWASDVDIVLASPTGQKIMLMSKVGGGGSPTTNATLTFSTTATALLPQTGALVTGTYQPTVYGASTIVFPAPAPAAPYDGSFAGLVGQTPNGTWSLYVVDGWAGDQGSIAGGWTLTVTSTGTAPTPPTISDITNQTTTTGTPTVAIPFTVGDADTALSSLTLGGTASNTTLVPNGSITFGGSGANCTVTVSPATGQTGTSTITVTVSDGSLTATDTFLLTVNAPLTTPVFTTQPASLALTTGSSATFAAAASGNPVPTYQWKKNGMAIAGATAASYSIASVTPADASTYTVAAANSVGSATSTGAVLTVNSAPMITTQPVTQTVTKGAAVTFKVVASGSPAPTYQWKKNGSKISGATGASYTIASVASGNAGTYTVVGTNSLGSVSSAGAVLTVKTTTAPAVYRVDFNGDGKSDLLWQNSTTGECSVWLMSGTVVGSKVSLGTGPAGLKICGTGDFNNDGKTDILWQNSATGACSVWLMNGTTVTSTVALGTVTPGWQLCGAGDFNGDGKSDLVWQNRTTGECSVWLMNGTTVSSIVSLGFVSTDLMLAGTGDFNKDGQSDILWQNEVTGEYGVWLMAGTTVSSSVTLGTVTLDWQLCGAGDYNADQQSDLLWQNLLTGESTVWLMNGTTVSSKVSLGMQPLDWLLRN